MTALLVKNMPQELHEKLRRRAKTHHRSMNREVVAILERELERPNAQELPRPVKTGKPVDHDWIVQVIRNARDGKR
jgi:plasmid stability protein